jgi:hypothetical protein
VKVAMAAFQVVVLEQQLLLARRKVGNPVPASDQPRDRSVEFRLSGQVTAAAGSNPPQRLLRRRRSACRPRGAK